MLMDKVLRIHLFVCKTGYKNPIRTLYLWDCLQGKGKGCDSGREVISCNNLDVPVAMETSFFFFK